MVLVLGPADELVGGGVDAKHDGEKQDAHDKQRAVVDAAERDLAEFLGNDARKRVGRLQKRADAAGKIRDFDAVAGDEQNDHGLTDDAAQAEQHGRQDAGEGGGDDDAEGRLDARGAERVGGLGVGGGDVVESVLGQREDGGNAH